MIEPRALPVKFDFSKSTLTLIERLIDMNRTNSGELFSLTARDQSYRRINQDIAKNNGKIAPVRDLDQTQAEKFAERLKTFAGKDYAAHLIEYSVSQEVKRKIDTQLPDFLLQHQPVYTAQTLESPFNLIPHRDHERTSGLMYLFRTDQAETVWYEPTEDFEVLDMVRIPDFGRVQEIYRTRLEPRTWYAFDHYTYHGVENFAKQDTLRTAFCIDFETLSYADLVEIMKEHADV
jgi:hypothetical protein